MLLGGRHLGVREGQLHLGDREPAPRARAGGVSRPRRREAALRGGSKEVFKIRNVLGRGVSD